MKKLVLDTESLRDAIDACPVGIISLLGEEVTDCQCEHCHGCCSEKAD